MFVDLPGVEVVAAETIEEVLAAALGIEIHEHVMPLPFTMERTIPTTTLPILHANSQHTIDS
ncbi:hypothetical protein D3C85_1868770 [compost metagenome]